MFQKIHSDIKLKKATHFPSGGLKCQEAGTNKTWGDPFWLAGISRAWELEAGMSLYRQLHCSEGKRAGSCFSGSQEAVSWVVCLRANIGLMPASSWRSSPDARLLGREVVPPQRQMPRKWKARSAMTVLAERRASLGHTAEGALVLGAVLVLPSRPRWLPVTQCLWGQLCGNRWVRAGCSLPLF